MSSDRWIFETLNALVLAPVGTLEAAIETALTQVCAQAQLEAATLFRRQDSGKFRACSSARPGNAAQCGLPPAWLDDALIQWLQTAPDPANAQGDAVGGSLTTEPGNSARLFAPIWQGATLFGVLRYDLSPPAAAFTTAQTDILRPVSTMIGSVLIRASAEKQSLETTLRLSTIVEVMDNLVSITDVAQRIVWVNAAFERQTGWALHEIIGKDLGELLRCEESDPETVREVNEAIAATRPYKGELVNQDRHGGRYWIDFNILPLFDTSGILQGFVSIETVVTHLHMQSAAIKRLAGKAAAAQHRLENAIMALPDGVLIFDAQDRLIAVNKAYQLMFPELASLAVPGATLTDLLWAGIEKGIFFDRDSGESKELWLQGRLAGYREPQSMDEVRLPDGRWLRRINMRTSDGGCIAVGIDITNRHAQVASLNEANQNLTRALQERDMVQDRLVGIMDGAEVGTWEWDIASDCLQVGGYWCAILGLDPHLLTGKGAVDFRPRVHPEDMARQDQSRWPDLMGETDIIEQEFRMRHSAGHWVWVLSRSRVAERAPDGTPLSVIGVHLDIDRRKRLEHDLTENRAFLAQIMETSTSALIVTDEEGSITFANPEAETVLGLTRSALLGRRYDDPAWTLERVSGGPIPEEEFLFRRAIREGAPVRGVQIVLIGSDGTRRILSCNAAPLNLATPNPSVVVSIIDVTDQLRATAQLQGALTRAEEMSRAKSAFLANMSHEIRTPLNGVLGMAEVLASVLTAPDQKRMIDTIRNSGETLLTVLNGILDMSKIEAGKMELEEALFLPLDMLRKLEAIYTVQAEEKGVAFEVLSNAGCERPRRGDPHRIQQILNNLLNNAIKFTETGSVTLKLSCRPGKPMVIEVSDTGIGMTPEQAALAFESFRQADDSTTRRFGGTGLGLSIVNQLVKLMGGEITLDSVAMQGTRIRISLPLAEGSVVSAVASLAADAGRGDLLHGVRLLCADDNATNRLVLKEMLLPSGAVLTEVQNGQEAVDAWAEALQNGAPFDLLMLDITMPVRDGNSALAEIRALEVAKRLSAVPAIAVTANAMPHQVADYIVGGFDTHLAKPFKQKDLLHAIHSLLGT